MSNARLDLYIQQGILCLNGFNKFCLVTNILN